MTTSRSRTRYSVLGAVVNVMTVSVLCLLLGVSIPLVSLQAQQASYGPVYAHVNSDTTPLPKSLATITTDTGDFAQGHHDFGKYTDIRMCLVATANARDVLRRTLKAWDYLDLIQGTPERDTLPARVAVVARNCGARFTVAGTAVADLPLLFDLALFARNDSMAHAALARLVDVAPTAPEKHQVLLSYLTRYLKAEPARLAAADSIVAQIDKLGDAGLPERIVAHNTLLNFYGRKHYNSRLVRREAEQVIALERRMPEQEWNKLAPLGSAYIDLMLWAWLNYPDSMPMVAQQYQQDLRSPAVQSALRKICVDDRKASSTCTLASAPIDTVIQALLRPSNGFQIQQMAPPIRADFWFPAPGRGSVQPAPGVVSLIIKPVLINNCVDTPGACKELLSKLRRLMDRYGSSGLSITMLVDVPGYRMGGDPGPADSVAQSYRMYLQDYFKWPVTVAVRTKKIIYRLPSPDGRIFYGDTKYGDVYDSNVVVITDQSGKVIYTSSNVDLDANIGVVPPLELFVEHALAVSKQAAHSTPAAVPSAHR